MAFKVGGTVVANNSAVVQSSTIAGYPASMPRTVSITGPATGSYYQISISGSTVSIF